MTTSTPPTIRPSATNHPPAANPGSGASAGTRAGAVANPGHIVINARDVANPDGRPTLGPNPKFNMTAYIMLCTGIGTPYCKSSKVKWGNGTIPTLLYSSQPSRRNKDQK